MEDRLTPWLYLELTDREAGQYGRTRAGQVLGLPGVERASWWTNCVPFRDDLPRTMEEFQTLGLFEVDGSFAPPADRPDDIRGVHFRQYPRPGQGSISDHPTLGLEVVLISPRRPELAQALRDWGDFVHIRDIAAAAPDHFTMITPYENLGDGAPRFMHLYELDTDDPEPAFRAMTPTTVARIGAPGTHPEQEWAWHEALRIDYVNTFRRVGASPVPSDR
jgi:hypothetical protein